MWRLVFAYSSLFILASFLAGANCQQVKVPVDGHKKFYKPESREASLYKAALAAQEKQDIAKEKELWKRLIEEYPQSALVPKAQYRLGLLSYQQGQWKQAIHHLKKALPQITQNPERKEGLKAYAISLYRAERWQEALHGLEEIYPNLSPAEQKAFRTMLLTSARRAHQPLAVIKWQAMTLPDLAPTERQQARQKIIRAIDENIPLAQLRTLYEQKTNNSHPFPYDYIALRLAKSYFHQQHYAHCQKILRRLLGDLPTQHPLQSQARQLLAQLHSLADQPIPNAIGVIYPQTGPYRGVAPWIRNALTMAVEGTNIRLIYADSASDPATAAKMVEKLVKQDKVIAIFGPIAKKTSLAAAYKAQELGVPLFSITYREDLTKIGPFIFRNNLTLSRMGRAMARYALKIQGLKRFAVFYPNSPYGRIQTKAFWQEIERLGGEIVGAESYPPYSPDLTKPAEALVGRRYLRERASWRKLYRQLKGLRGYQYRRLYKKLVKQFPPVIDFDAIFIPETWKRAAMIAPTLAQQDIEVKLHYPYWEKQVIELYRKRNKPLRFVQLLGTNGWNNENIFALEPRHVVGTIFCVRYFTNSKKKVVQNFIREYQRRYPEQTRRGNTSIPPIHISAYTYDTMRILIQIASQKDAPKTRNDFRKALLKIKYFPGVTGRISIQKSGEALAYIRFIYAHRKQEFRLKYLAKELIP